MKNLLKILFVFTLFLAVGCATSVKRIDTTATVDLSGRWNDTDSRLVSEEMITDSLQRSWLGKFKKEHKGNLPVVIVGTVKNRSHEHINVQTFIKDLERALINSGEVDFVAGKDERDEIRDERKDKAVHSSEETAKSAGEELGADFMLKGTISTIQDKTKGKAVMFYQVNLELINVETNRKAWIGEKKIKKLIKRPRFSL